MSTPLVPPRPQRAQGGSTAVSQEMPQVPPRPTRKQAELDAEREAYTRSPLNEPPAAFPRPKASEKSSGGPKDENRLYRPPSINMPSIGQEGLEYTSYDELPPAAHGVKGDGAPQQEEQVVHATGLPMHAPRASLAQSAAKARIQPVTRTDSSQAAAAGLSHVRTHEAAAESCESLSLSRTISRTEHPLRAKNSFNRSSTSVHQHRDSNGGTPRPPSIFANDEEQGIPEIGVQIPLYKNAGDVQAPSPAPTQSQHAPGIGFFNDGSTKHHNRKRSSRHEFKFEDQYGRHHEPVDQFEKEWAKKHPKESAREGHNLHLPRPETALSSEELNKLVRENIDAGMGKATTFGMTYTRSDAQGAGTSPAAVGTPSQEIGWAATDEFASRLASPKPSPLPIGGRQRGSSGTQPEVGSPLRKSFQAEGGFLLHRKSSAAIDSEDDVIHVEPTRRGSKVTGGGAADNTIDLGPKGGNTEEEGGWYDEKGYGTPILASDEILKRPGSAYLQPAVNPEADRDQSEVDEDLAKERSRRGSSQPNSRPSSRPNSVHGGALGGPLHRFISHEEHHGSGVGTPLEEIEEYEPLFPEGEDARPKAPVEKLKSRPGMAAHHFPSQDVWEDTADSLQYTTTVDTPEPPQEARAPAPESSAAQVFETPEQEQKRRELNNVNDMNSSNKTFAKPHFKAGVHDDMSRPGVQRFPSQDVWEDTPESMLHVTTVNGPQEDELKSPPDDRSSTFVMAGRQNEEQSNARNTSASRPQIPARPEKKSKLAQDITRDIKPEDVEAAGSNVADLGVKATSPSKTQAPTIPDRPKPSIPARPARKLAPDQSEGAPLAKTSSIGSNDSQDTIKEAPATKPKPSVPARPVGSKIAAMQAGFMQDLNKRLGLGPQQPPPKVKEPEAEEEEEKAPLADARKGRAKGPPRRKPAASPDSGTTASTAFSIFSPQTLWLIDEREELTLPSTQLDTTEAEKLLTRNVSKNAYDVSPALSAKNDGEPAGEAVTPLDKNDPIVQGDATLAPHVPSTIGYGGDTPEPSITQATVDEVKAVQPELASALHSAEPAPTSAEGVQQGDEKALQTGVEPAAAEAKETPLPLPEAGKPQQEAASLPADGDEAGNTSSNLV